MFKGLVLVLSWERAFPGVASVIPRRRSRARKARNREGGCILPRGGEEAPRRWVRQSVRPPCRRTPSPCSSAVKRIAVKPDQSLRPAGITGTTDTAISGGLLHNSRLLFGVPAPFLSTYLFRPSMRDLHLKVTRSDGGPELDG